LTLGGAGTITVSGPIGNGGTATNGAITVTNIGLTTFSGSNSYSGATTVNTNATLVAANSSALGTTNTGTTVKDGGTLALQGGINITNESVSITGQGAGGGGALRNLSGTNTYGGGITFSTGTNRINSDAGTLTLTALSNGLSSARQLVVGGAGNVVLAASLGGSSSLGTVTKEGVGTLTLGNTNTYAGNTFVNGGTLLYGTNDALGAVAVTVDSGTMNIGAFSDTVGAIIVTNGGSILGSGGTLTGTSYSVASSTISANLAGSGDLTVNGVGSTAVLSGSNTYTGTTTLGTTNGQTLRATTTNSLSANSTLAGSSSSGNTPTLNLAAGAFAMKNYQGGNMIFTATNGAATLTFTNTGAANTILGGSRTLNASNVAVVFSGELNISGTTNSKNLTLDGDGNFLFAGPITSTNAFGAGLIKSGTGTATLRGVNTYSNTNTTVSGGLLIIASTGVINANSPVSVSSGGSLGGSGTIGGQLSVSGNLFPGSDSTNAATLTVQGPMTNNSGSFTTFRVFGNNTNDSVTAPVGATIRGTVQVTLQPGYTPQSGNAFDFVIGPISGTPTNFILPTLSTNLAWVTTDWTNTGILSITNTGPVSNYDLWLANYPSLTGTNALPAANPDGDPYNNGMEFAFDGNPTIGSPAFLTAVKVGTNSVFNYVARKNPPGGVTYQVQFTGNLTTGWTNSTVTVSNSANTNGLNIPADYERKEFIVPAAGKEFYRVQATIAP
jgi:autotransporter-associated beta strand protein